MRRMNQHRIRVAVASAMVAAGFGVAGVASPAAAQQWTGQGFSPAWADSGNWQFGAVPVSSPTASVIFTNAGNWSMPIQNLANPFTLHRLSFFGDSFTLNGDPLRFEDPGTTDPATLSLSATGPITIVQPVNFSHNLNISGNNPASVLTMLGGLSGTNQGVVTVTTPAPVRILGGGSYGALWGINQADISISGGTTDLLGDLSSPSQSVVLNNASLNIDGGALVRLNQRSYFGGTDGAHFYASGPGTQVQAFDRFELAKGDAVVRQGARFSGVDLVQNQFSSGGFIVREGGYALFIGNTFLGGMPGTYGQVIVRDNDSWFGSDVISLGGIDDTNHGGRGSIDVQPGGSVASDFTHIWTSNSFVDIDQGSFTTGAIIPHNNAAAKFTIRDPANSGYAMTVGLNNESSYYRGTITGTGSLMKIGAGTLELGRADTSDDPYSGRTTVFGGTLSIAHPKAMGSGSLSITDGRVELKPTLPTATRIRAVQVNGSGKLDVNNNDMIIGNGLSLAQVQTLIRNGRNGGAWDGTGIISTAARNQAHHATTIGLLSGPEYHAVSFASSFSALDYFGDDSLMKYTYYGDTDFNGVVNFDDYVRTDNGFNTGLSGWLNGDFDYNGTVNFDDYVLIDLAFNTQSGSLGRALAFLDGADRSERGMSDPALQVVRDHAAQFGEIYGQHFVASVPEPSVLALIGVPASTCMAVRRRRRQ